MRERQILWLDPNTLQVDSSYVRKKEGDIAGLASTIREFGVLEPLGVRQVGTSYRVVYGNRRRRAAVLAGVEAVPCVEVADSEEEDYLVHHLIENLQRRQLGDMEQAEGLAKLRRRLAQRAPTLSESELDERVAAMVGFSVRTVQRYLSLRELAAGVRDLIQDEELSVSQAQHLRLIQEPARQLELATLAVQLELPASRLRDAAQLMARHKGLSAEEAIHLAGSVTLEEERAGTPPALDDRVKRESAVVADEDADLWEEQPRDEIDALLDASPAGAALETTDRSRLRRIRTIDAFCDEVDRLARALEEGDLAKAAARQPEAAPRLRLAYRQLRWVADALGAFLAERGWHETEPVA
ncbi:MAG: ParB/RepB/Spo0J family partition protein [Chloroflexota bacterium]|nr:ParB/RepB/Spo0J family partition protein [Dehalococcoidia bacterium]MDW8253408.1 ParB/RepB/Spo0J family partition protein [Chloroflexota bacterium]